MKMKNKNKLDIVITMAGLGSRFRKAGFNVPKYMIEVKGKTLFEWSLISLQPFYEIASTFIFIVLKDKAEDVLLFINKKCKLLGIKKYNIVCIDRLTDGQASTALLASKYWNLDHSLLIYNIDTYIEPSGVNPNSIRGDGFIPCFNALGNHWSFAKLGENGKVIEVREKERISDHCTVGAYYFKSCRLFSELYDRYYKTNGNLEKGEKYVAPLYNEMIKDGYNVYITDIDSSLVHVLGTPEELTIFSKI